MKAWVVLKRDVRLNGWKKNKTKQNKKEWNLSEMTLVMIWDYLGSLVDQMASAGTAGRSAGLCLLCSQHICISCCTLSWQLSLFLPFSFFFFFLPSASSRMMWKAYSLGLLCRRALGFHFTDGSFNSNEQLPSVCQSTLRRMQDVPFIPSVCPFSLQGKKKKRKKKKKKKKRKPRRPRAVRHQKSTICRKISSDTSGPGTGPTPPAAVCKTNTKIRR